MAHTIGDIIYNAIIGKCEGQTIMNTWHYRVAASQSTNTDQQDNLNLASYLRQQFEGAGSLNTYFACLPTNYLSSEVRSQKIFPARSMAGISSVLAAGTFGGVANALNVCAVMYKKGTRGTRHSQGSMHIGPIGVNGMNLGDLDGGLQANVILFGQALRTQIVIPGIVATYVPIIYNPGQLPNYDDIFTVGCANTVRTLRRRTKGHGI